jgi:phosphate transport system permease protein
MTAGIVMGIMLIPFVSSLSDDIINAVPQAMRDGSYGLGATQSETDQAGDPARRPAGHRRRHPAGRLARHRRDDDRGAGRGAAAKLSLNPFEAMTTVTVKIVSQLTGDTDFSSPRRWWPSRWA